LHIILTSMHPGC